MNHFNQLPEFDREFKKLSKKYRSLSQDIADLEDVLETFPMGNGKNFVIIHADSQTKIVKVRLACRSLRDRSIRLIYACHEKIFTFVYVELYFKGDRASENRERIRDYLKKQGKCPPHLRQI